MNFGCWWLNNREKKESLTEWRHEWDEQSITGWEIHRARDLKTRINKHIKFHGLIVAKNENDWHWAKECVCVCVCQSVRKRSRNENLIIFRIMASNVWWLPTSDNVLYSQDIKCQIFSKFLMRVPFKRLRGRNTTMIVSSTRHFQFQWWQFL